jgi:hypothetical protein
MVNNVACTMCSKHSLTVYLHTLKQCFSLCDPPLEYLTLLTPLVISCKGCIIRSVVTSQSGLRYDELNYIKSVTLHQKKDGAVVYKMAAVCHLVCYYR